jgi:hypothetical protein
MTKRGFNLTNYLVFSSVGSVLVAGDALENNLINQFSRHVLQKAGPFLNKLL